MRDFTVEKYKVLLDSLINAGYEFRTFSEFLNNSSGKCIILRHDVDLLPANSLVFARIQHLNKVKGVYYFRAVPESWDETIVKEIADMGHEIGYHYENLTTTNGDFVKGIKDFEKSLFTFRKTAPVKTICMHGSPRSKFDSKDLWSKFDYKNYGVVGEPYFDIDFKKVFYLTDTGRKWDGNKVSVRDKVESSFRMSFNKTDEIILAANKNELPQQIMFTFHPQRWNDNLVAWTKELVLQSVKNRIKKWFYVKK